MSLKERTPTPAHRGTKCSVGTLVARIDVDDVATLNDWLADPDLYPGSSIAEALNAEYGSDISGWTLQRHRRGHCRCGR